MKETMGFIEPLSRLGYVSGLDEAEDILDALPRVPFGGVDATVARTRGRKDGYGSEGDKRSRPAAVQDTGLGKYAQPLLTSPCSFSACTKFYYVGIVDTMGLLYAREW